MNSCRDIQSGQTPNVCARYKAGLERRSDAMSSARSLSTASSRISSICKSSKRQSRRLSGDAFPGFHETGGDHRHWSKLPPFSLRDRERSSVQMVDHRPARQSSAVPDNGADIAVECRRGRFAASGTDVEAIDHHQGIKHGHQTVSVDVQRIGGVVPRQQTILDQQQAVRRRPVRRRSARGADLEGGIAGIGNRRLGDRQVRG